MPYPVQSQTPAASIPHVEDPRYELVGLLGQGGMGAVYRARDRLTRQDVAIKCVALRGRFEAQPLPPTDDSPQTAPAPATDPAMLDPEGTYRTKVPISATMMEEQSSLEQQRLALAHEFRVLTSLRHPHIVSVFDFGFDIRKRPYFTMELLESPRTITEASDGMTMSARVRLLAQLLRALSYLHRRGILHRDLKPSNVLCVGDNVKVLDFGIAVREDQVHNVAGTVEYMAPEILLGDSPSTASDLYALGVISWELLAGRSPYSRESMTRALADMLGPSSDKTLPPDVMQLLEGYCSPSRLLDGFTDQSEEPSALPEPPHSLDAELRLWLQKLVAREPEQRYQFADEALEALGRAIGELLPIETLATRESFLQSSEMVGRDAELSTLMEALHRAQKGSGSGWLIYGESGVGKSRFLEELRAQATIYGVRTLRGQAILGGSSAYQTWLGLLKPLCLYTSLGELEASVLKSLVPELPTMLERPIHDAPVLDPLATRLRLLNIIAAVLLRHSEPMVLLLEDLHWADTESVALLRRLLPELQQRPLLLIATCRDEERSVPLPDPPEINVLRLLRLRNAEIARLSRAMLGEAGRRADLIALLDRETEGNTLFIVEVVRALAEEAGGLHAVGRGALPNRVVAGGVRAVLMRRIVRVPETARELLKLAAIAGRQVDAVTLAALHAEPEPLLRACADAAVLEAIGDSWRFAHDQLREVLLEQLSETEQRRMHQRVGEAMERAYPDALKPMAALAYHFERGGDARRAAKYTALAGEQALQRGAISEAVSLLSQAVARQEQSATPAVEQAQTRRSLITALYGNGRLSDCIETSNQLLLRLGYPMPRSLLAQGLGTARELARQVLHRNGHIKSITEPETSAVLSKMLAAVGVSCDAYAWLGKRSEMLYTTLWALNLSERIEDRSSPVFFLVMVAYIASLIPIPWAAELYIRQAAAALARSSDVRADINYHRALSLIRLAAGRWREAEYSFDRTIELARQIGDDPMALFGLLQKSGLPLMQGDFDALDSLLGESLVLAERTQNELMLLLCYALKAAIFVRRDALEQARSELERAARLPLPAEQPSAEIYLLGMRALLAVRKGERSLARQYVDAGLVRALGSPVGSHCAYEGYANLVQAYLELWEALPALAEKKEVHRQLERALRITHQHARIFTVAAARAHVWQGRYDWQRGEAARAKAGLERGLLLALRGGLTYEQAYAHLWLSKLYAATETDPTGAIEHRAQAQHIFTRIKATWELNHLLGTGAEPAG